MYAAKISYQALQNSAWVKQHYLSGFSQRPCVGRILFLPSFEFKLTRFDSISRDISLKCPCVSVRACVCTVQSETNLGPGASTVVKYLRKEIWFWPFCRRHPYYIDSNFERDGFKVLHYPTLSKTLTITVKMATTCVYAPPYIVDLGGSVNFAVRPNFLAGRAWAVCRKLLNSPST